MRFWFFVMTFMSATALGNQLAEEHYKQIVQDFINGNIPEIERLAEVKWRTGRCVFQENPGDLNAAILQIDIENNGPYYGKNYTIRLHQFLTAPDTFDNYSADDFALAIYKVPENGTLYQRIGRTGYTVLISDYDKFMRSFEEILLLSIQNGMCYFFREVTE